MCIYIYINYPKTWKSGGGNQADSKGELKFESWEYCASHFSVFSLMVGQNWYQVGKLNSKENLSFTDLKN